MSLILFNYDIFVDCILAISFGVLSGSLWGWLTRALKT